MAYDVFKSQSLATQKKVCPLLKLCFSGNCVCILVNNMHILNLFQGLCGSLVDKVITTQYKK